MEQYFATMFEDVRHERSLILLLSLTDPDVLKQSKFTDDEVFSVCVVFQELNKKFSSRKTTQTENTKRAYRNGFVRKTNFRSININTYFSFNK